jgi:rare lipoprotein A
MTRFLGPRSRLLHKLKNTCLPYHCHYTMTKEKESLRPPLFTTFRCRVFPSNAQGRMEALQANHERPANPHERALPSNGVHPHGPPCESGAEAPEPSCLRSIARNGGSNGKRNCGNVGFAGRRLPALANYSPKQVLKSILLSAFIAFGALAPAAVEAKSSCAHASFYGVGDGFHGLRAADGSRFDAHGLTTAHKTLPFGTRLRVTNPANNKSVIVTVTDRGPFIAGRSLDLSYGAFRQIASTSQGVARVCFARV